MADTAAGEAEGEEGECDCDRVEEAEEDEAGVPAAVEATEKAEGASEFAAVEASAEVGATVRLDDEGFDASKWRNSARACSSCAGLGTRAASGSGGGAPASSSALSVDVAAAAASSCASRNSCSLRQAAE
jgi:hypothetical protein